MDPTSPTTLAALAYPLLVFAEALGICVAIDLWCLGVRDRKAARVRRCRPDRSTRFFLN